MTVLYVGTERDALADSAGGGVFTEGNTAGYYDSALARGYTTLTSGASSYLDMPIAASGEVWIHFVRRYFGLGDGSNQPAVHFMDVSDNVVARLRQISSTVYGLEYWNGASYTAVAPHVNPASALHTYDIHIKKDAATGIAEWYYDGILQASATGIDTSAYGNITHVRFVYGAGGSSAFSEVIITDAGPTVGWGLTTFWPLADGADTGGTGTYADVDELVLSTVDFIAMDTTGQQHSFTKGSHTYINKISAVGISAKIRVADGTGPQQIKPYVSIAGTRYYGTTFALTTSFTNYHYLWLVDPATTLAWDYADVGSNTYMQFGWEAVT